MKINLKLHRPTWLVVALMVGTGPLALAASNWALQPFPASNGAPVDPARTGTPGAYDTPTNTLIAFGGFAATLNDASTNDTILLSNANGLGGAPVWSTLTANGASGSPPPRSFSAAVYDAANNRLIVFGGATWPNGNSSPTQYLNDTWVLSNANGQGGPPQWTQLTPAGTLPPARYGHTAVYDAAANRLIVYGGNFDQQTFVDVWVLSNANGLGGTPAWTELSPGGSTPIGGYGATAVYDEANNIMTVFAGYKQTPQSSLGFVLFNSVYTLSHANGLGGKSRWTNIVANGSAGAPGKRDSLSAVYDAANNRMIIFGGGSLSTYGYPEFNDVWVLNHANGMGGTPAWTQIHPSGIAPGRRYSHSAVYDAMNNRMIMFGGDSADSLFYGVWILTDANGL